MKFFYFDEVYKNMQLFVEYYTNTPINILIIQHMISLFYLLVLAIIYILIQRLTEPYLFYPKSFESYMIDDTGGVLVSKSESGKYDLVSGNLVLFLKEECGVSEYSDEELKKLILKYCKYVDKAYGKDSSLVDMNFGKDYKALLSGNLT